MAAAVNILINTFANLNVYIKSGINVEGLMEEFGAYHFDKPDIHQYTAISIRRPTKQYDTVDNARYILYFGHNYTSNEHF